MYGAGSTPYSYIFPQYKQDTFVLSSFELLLIPVKRLSGSWLTQWWCFSISLPRC